MKGITWGLITSKSPSFRILPEDSTFDVGGSSIFFKDKELIEYVIALLNSKVYLTIAQIMNPTLNFQVKDIRSMPLIISNREKVESISDKNIDISKQDWDAFETSWDFKCSPLLVNKATTLEQAYNNWSQEALDRFNQLKANEEELNRIFIDLYSLQDELTPEEEDKEVSVRKADRVRDIKAFLSYFIGCVFGRYSLDQDGLAFAGGDWNASLYSTFKPNKENIILLTDRQYFDDERDIIEKGCLINYYRSQM